jgi:hypothetical protein
MYIILNVISPRGIPSNWLGHGGDATRAPRDPVYMSRDTAADISARRVLGTLLRLPHGAVDTEKLANDQCRVSRAGYSADRAHVCASLLLVPFP